MTDLSTSEFECTSRDALLRMLKTERQNMFGPDPKKIINPDPIFDRPTWFTNRVLLNKLSHIFTHIFRRLQKSTPF